MGFTRTATGITPTVMVINLTLTRIRMGLTRRMTLIGEPAITGMGTGMAVTATAAAPGKKRFREPTPNEARTGQGLRFAGRGVPVALGRSELCEGWQGVAGDAHDGPLGHGGGAEGVVEVDRGLVPVEDGPLEARAFFGYGDGGDGAEEGFADALAEEGGPDEQVL